MKLYSVTVISADGCCIDSQNFYKTLEHARAGIIQRIEEYGFDYSNAIDDGTYIGMRTEYYRFSLDKIDINEMDFEIPSEMQAKKKENNLLILMLY